MSGRPKKALRVAFGEALLELAEVFPQMVVLDADISKSLRTEAFARAYPERHFNFGVAEQEMLAASAGLAAVGKIPLACTYAVFAALRAAEQIRTLLCYPALNAKIVCSHGGLEVGWDGPTHQAIEDVAVMRALPNMAVVVPADANAVPSLLRQAIERPGPVYFRMGRNPTPVLYGADQEFTFGKAIELCPGSDLTLVAMGIMVAYALEAAERLSGEGISARVLDVHTVKPLDGAALERAARETGAVVTLEDHNIIGGLGSAVAEYLGQHAPVPLRLIGVPDTFCESGEPGALFDKYGLGLDSILSATHELLKIKATFRTPPLPLWERGPGGEGDTP